MYAGEVVEEASTSDLLRTRHHPYTEGLLGAMPRVGRNAERSGDDSRNGAAADQLARRMSFREPLPYAWERCASEHPPLYQIGGGTRRAAISPSSRASRPSARRRIAERRICEPSRAHGRSSPFADLR
jgi:oligopeptide/dipeptide ABC transporter ATP-binding protein